MTDKVADSVDLNQFDPEKFEKDESYQEEILNTPAGDALAALFTSVTLQDCGEFLAFVQPELLPRFFAWAERNYPELDIDPEEAVGLIKEAVEKDETGIEKP